MDFSTLKPNGQRSKNLLNAFYILVFVESIHIVWKFYQYYVQITFDDDFSDDSALLIMTSEDNFSILMNICFIFSYTICVITFILWFRRAYYNLHQKSTSPSYSEGWAAGSWFVPFINLYRPYKIMKDLYQITAEKISEAGLALEKPLHTRLVGWWWASWIAANLLTRINEKAYQNNINTIDQLINYTSMDIFIDMIHITSMFIVIRMVKTYSAAEVLLPQTRGDYESYTVQEEPDISEPG